MYTEHEYLAHSGIRGMKWGIRRYRNEDGTLTEAGKKRYAKMNAAADRMSINSEARYVKKMAKIGKAQEKSIEKTGSTVSKKELRLAYKAEKIMNRMAANKKLNTLRKKEIKTGFDYYEHFLKKRMLVGYVVGGTIGEGVAGVLARKSATNKFGHDPVLERHRILGERVKADAKSKKQYKEAVRSIR